MKLPPFEYLAASTVAEAVAVLAGDEDAKVIAGGQSLMPLLALRLARPSVLVDLDALPCHDVVVDGSTLRVGALVRQRRLERDPDVARVAPLLAEAARHVGYPATRNRGTLAGSLAHADPVAELPAVAVALGATVLVTGAGGSREVRCADLAAGFFTTTLAPDEVITEVLIPVAGGASPGGVGVVAGVGGAHGAAWCEWAPRAHDFPVAGVGVDLEVDDAGACASVRAAACGIGGSPLALTSVLEDAGVLGARAGQAGLAAAVAGAVEGAAVAAAGADGERAELAGLLAARAVQRALTRAGAGSEVAA